MFVVKLTPTDIRKGKGSYRQLIQTSVIVDNCLLKQLSKKILGTNLNIELYPCDDVQLPKLLERLSMLSRFDQHCVILMNSFHLRGKSLHFSYQKVVILVFLSNRH